MEALKEGGRSGTSGAGQNRTRGLLVVSEVALALVALVGTALFARSFQNARAIHPGFDASNVLFAQYHLDTFCQNAEQRAQFCYRLRDRIRRLPGIAAVSFANSVPLAIGTDQLSDMQVEGYVPGPSEEMQRVERHESRRAISRRCAFPCWKGATSPNATTAAARG